MQANHKEEILKLLNLDSMIKDYLQQPRLNRKTPATNNKPKQPRQLINNSIGLLDSSASNKNKTIANVVDRKSKLMKTVDNSFANNRNHSVGSMARKTIQPQRLKQNKNQSASKLEASKHRKTFQKQWTQYTQNLGYYVKEVKAPQSRVCASSKIFKMDDTLDGNQMTVCHKKKTQNESTHVKDSESEVEKQLNAGIQCNKRIKLKIPGCSALKLGTTLKGRYMLQKLIGRGLSGEVYKARDILSERLVAIKIIQPGNIEYEFIKQLQHPNMINYYNSFIENDKRFLVLQYLPHSLAQIVRKKKLSQQQIQRIFKAISSGLMYLHSMSYVHRDIKLDNLVANQDLTTIKFIDFGLCLDINECDSKEMKRFCGTTSYMAPQVISGSCRQPKKADIWSLGVVLYVLSVGRNPFSARQQFDVLQKIKNNKTVFPQQMSEKLKDLLARMLDKNPEKRPTIYQVVNSNWLNE